MLMMRSTKFHTKIDEVANSLNKALDLRRATKIVVDVDSQGTSKD